MSTDNLPRKRGQYKQARGIAPPRDDTINFAPLPVVAESICLPALPTDEELDVALAAYKEWSDGVDEDALRAALIAIREVRHED